jgi:hypothetical protein
LLFWAAGYRQRRYVVIKFEVCMIEKSKLENSFETRLYRKGFISNVSVIYLFLFLFCYLLLSLITRVIPTTHLQSFFIISNQLILFILGVTFIVFKYSYNKGETNSSIFNTFEFIFYLIYNGCLGFLFILIFLGFSPKDILTIYWFAPTLSLLILTEQLTYFSKYKNYLNKTVAFVIYGATLLIVSGIIELTFTLSGMIKYGLIESLGVSNLFDIAYSFILMYLAFQLLNNKLKFNEGRLSYYLILFILFLMLFYIFTLYYYDSSISWFTLYKGIVLITIYFINYLPSPNKTKFISISVMIYFIFFIIDLFYSNEIKYELTVFNVNIDLIKFIIPSTIIAAFIRNIYSFIKNGYNQFKTELNESYSIGLNTLKDAVDELNSKDCDIKMYSNLVSIILRKGAYDEIYSITNKFPEKFKNVFDTYISCFEFNNNNFAESEDYEAKLEKFKREIQLKISRDINEENSDAFNLLKSNKIAYNFIDIQKLEKEIAEYQEKGLFTKYLSKHSSKFTYFFLFLIFFNWVIPPKLIGQLGIDISFLKNIFSFGTNQFYLNNALIKEEIIYAYNFFEDEYKYNIYNVYDVLLEQGKKKRAKDIITKYHSVSPNLGSYLRLADYYFDDNDFETAIEHYIQILNKNDINYEYIINQIGLSYYYLNKFPNVINLLKDFSEEPEYYFSKRILALSYFKIGNLELAKQLLLHLIRIEDEYDSELNDYLGRVYFEQDSLELAEMYFEKDPQKLEKYEVLGYLAQCNYKNKYFIGSLEYAFRHLRLALVNNWNYEILLEQIYCESYKKAIMNINLKDEVLPLFKLMYNYCSHDTVGVKSFLYEAKKYNFDATLIKTFENKFY